MALDDNEEKLLRSVALQNAHSILLARQRAERELIQAKEALERKTEELSRSLAMLRATLEATTDGILVTNADREITGYNQKLVDMWGLSPEVMEARDHWRILDATSGLFAEPQKFRERIDEIYATSPAESFDLLELADARVFERFSRIQYVEERNVGRVWSFRDITESKRSEEALRQQREWFEVTLSSIGDAVITTDMQGKITFLNPVAEMMTGWKTTEAFEKSLEDIFNIINEDTRERVENPVHKVLSEGIVVGVANHTALIAKDGTERAIDDSAAPIRDPAGKISGAVMVFHDVTERRRAEKALRDSESRKSAILSASLDAIVTMDHRGLVSDFNSGAERIFGYRREDVIGKPLAELMIPEGLRQRHYEGLSRYLRTGESRILGRRVEMTGLRADGREFPAELSVTRIPGIEPAVFTATLRDITERKRAENALRESENRLRATFNQAAVGMAIVGLDGRFEQVNQRFTEIVGYTAEECYERTVASITHPDDRLETQTSIARLMAGEIADVVLEKRYIRKDGKVVWSRTAVTALKDATGRAQKIIGALEDITQRKEAEEERWRLTNVLEKSLNEIYIFDADTLRFEYVNGGALRNLGFTLDALRQMTPIDIKPEFTEASFREKLRPLLALEQEKLVFRTLHRRRDGSVYPVEAHHQVVARGDKRVFLAVILDITERERAEEALKEADRKKDHFLATLAHELRNPLVPIRNGLKILQLIGNASDTAESARTMMDQALDQLVRLVDDLLDISRITTGKLQVRKERVELATVIQSAVEASRPLIDEQGHELTVLQPPWPILLYADPTRLAQVFSNLLNNAAKYTNPGGRIRLCVEARDREAIVRVADTGIGLAADDLPRIFEMFAQVETQLERGREGLGIGLALVRGLVEMHDGKIEAYSQGLGRGSEFMVRLPTTNNDPLMEMQATNDGDNKGKSGVKHRILIVDDNRLSCDSTAMALRMMGYELATARDGLEGIECARTFRPDVILLDIGLPQMNGYEIARRIRAEPWGKSIFLIAVTGYGQEEDRRRSLEAGFDHHMVKPVNFDELGNKLAELSAV